jgi:hypothetical protein
MPKKRKSSLLKNEVFEILEAFEKLYDQWLDAHESLTTIKGLLESGNTSQAKEVVDLLFEKFEAESRQLTREFDQ